MNFLSLLAALFTTLTILFSNISFAESVPTKNKNANTISYLTGGHSYFTQLLKLALDKTEAEYGPYALQEKPWLGPKERMRKLLAQQEHIDVIWGTSSLQREQELTPIKINLLKGLNQYRVLLIHPYTQEKFNDVTTIEDLKSLTAIVGVHWQDAEIMKRNGLPIITSLDYQKATEMFKKRRADYYPRGIYEVWKELKTTDFSSFVLEKNIMLKYDAGYYFFVSPTDKLLANRIENGLKIALRDGSLEKLFFSYPEFAKGWRTMSDKQRKVIYLP